MEIPSPPQLPPSPLPKSNDTVSGHRRRRRRRRGQQPHRQCFQNKQLQNGVNFQKSMFRDITVVELIVALLQCFGSYYCILIFKCIVQHFINDFYVYFVGTAICFTMVLFYDPFYQNFQCLFS